MTPTRRAVLAAIGTSVLPAGCLASSPSESPVDTGGTTTTTPSPADESRHVRMGRTVTVGSTRMTVENPRVRKAVVSRGMAHTRVVANAGQFVVVDVTIDGGAPDRPVDPDLRSAVDERSLSGGDPLPTVEGAERYAFPFPAGQPDSAAIQWATDASTVYWDLPASTLETLALEPTFVVRDVRAPRRDGRRVLDLSVANTGDRNGQFVARVSFEGFSGGSVLDVPVPAGETRSYTGSPGKVLRYFENHGGTTLTIRYPADDGLTRVERTVRGATTTTGGSS